MKPKAKQSPESAVREIKRKTRNASNKTHKLIDVLFISLVRRFFVENDKRLEIKIAKVKKKLNSIGLKT